MSIALPDRCPDGHVWERYEDICNCDICDGTPLGLLLECSRCGKPWRDTRAGTPEWKAAWAAAPWPPEDDDD